MPLAWDNKKYQISPPRGSLELPLPFDKSFSESEFEVGVWVGFSFSANNIEMSWTDQE